MWYTDITGILQKRQPNTIRLSGVRMYMHIKKKNQRIADIDNEGKIRFFTLTGYTNSHVIWS